MKKNCSKQASVLPSAVALVGLIVVLWPAAGQCQRSSRRGASESAAAADPNAAAQPNSWASFDIILKRNIFSRQRMPARRAEQAVRAAPPAPNVETYYVLRGVVQENDEFIAFIEDTQTDTVLRLRRGDRVARGTIKTLTLDGIEYQMEDKTTVVRMGLDLEGGQSALSASSMTNPATSPAPAATGQPAQTPAAAPPSGAEADILKRLMEQRRQQLGQ